MVVLGELDKKTLLRAGEAVTVHELKSILCKCKYGGEPSGPSG